MKQVIQNYGTGKIELTDVPVPLCKKGQVLVKTINSLISVGTEKSVVELGRKSLIGKAKARPEQFRRAVEKVKNEGFFKVWKEAMARLDESRTLGYSCAGVVIETGDEVSRLKKGDRVACIGAGFASHAEIISLPECLCVKIPEGVNCEEAAFGMLGIIAFQGVRCAEVKPGEKIAVLGLGLIGQLTIQILKALGCSVIGSDLKENKLKLAQSLGCNEVASAHDIERASISFTEGKGVDKIIITATSKDNSLIRLSAKIAKFRAKIILVGVVDINIPRQLFWEKELEFQVSKAGGYDPLFGQTYDYPEEYKKISQEVNLREFLQFVKEKKVQIKPLITHRFNINEALQAYAMITNKHSKEHYIGVLLEYGEKKEERLLQRKVITGKSFKEASRINIGIIGAGVFGRSVILPILKSLPDMRFVGIATMKGSTSRHAADKYNFEYCTTDYRQLIDDEKINTIFILTRHDLHAAMVKESLEAGKHVFVEKPLATTFNDLKMLYRLLKHNQQKFMVGFNRNFSNLTNKIKKRISDNHFPLMINMQINAGNVERGHWVFDTQEGGGRIIGEICHFVDLAQWLIGAYPQSVYTQNIKKNNRAINSFDNTASVIKFSDGSICTIVYTSLGNRSYPREEIRVFDNNAVYCIDDFRTLKIHSPEEKRTIKLSSQDLGYKNEFDYFFKDITTGSSNLLKLRKGYFFTTLVTLKMMESLETNKPVEINTEGLLE